MNPALLERLRCPETYQPLSPLTAAQLTLVNDAVAAGTLTDLAGGAVTTALEAGLLREDSALIFPIRDGLPSLLMDQAIAADCISA